MKTQNIYIILLVVLNSIVKSQLTTPLTYTFPIPDNNPPNSTVNTYTRAQKQINLQYNANGGSPVRFKYGFVTGGATNLLNLSLGSSPAFVSSTYLGSGSHPTTYTCGNGLPQLNTGKPVGETAGQFNVSNNGAATYNIPIQISPGTKGVQPSLNVFYSSQAGLGLLGVGWNLGGLSAISRTGKTPMYDGKFGSIDLSSNDIFALDGNRFFALSGTTGSNSTTYYTESESYATITSIGSQGNGPQYFTVRDKNGNIFEYGNTTDSRLAGANNNTVLIWYLSKFTDVFGNYMLYSYKQLPGELVIDKIEYTGNSAANLSPYNKITFNYIPLAEHNKSYINGVEFKQTQLLKDITCWAGSARFKKYIFDYEWREGTYLSSVKEVDASGNELNPTTFCWGDPSEYTGNTMTQNLNSNFTTLDHIDLNTVGADLNADGFTDYLAFNIYNQKRLRVFKNDFLPNYGTGNTTVPFTSIFDTNNNGSPFGNNEIMLASNVCDENNDGKQEVFSCIATNLTSTLSNDYYITKTYLDNSNNIQVAGLGTYHTSSGFLLNSCVNQFYYNIEDCNGDGNLDILRINHEELIITDTFNNQTYNYGLGGDTASYVRPFNMDNDGITDFLSVIFYPSYLNVTVLKLTNGVISPALNFQIYYPSNVNGSGAFRATIKHLTSGDINGDGLDDLVYLDQNYTTLNLLLNKGDNTFTSPIQVSSFVPLNSSSKDVDIVCTDLNGDGKEDIIINEKISSSLSQYQSYLSFGDIILKAGSYFGNIKVGEVTKVHKVPVKNKRGKITGTKDETVHFDVTVGTDIVSADYNGDGIIDFADFSGNSGQLISNRVNGESRKVINQIFTPMRNNIRVFYANLGTRYGYFSSIKDEVLRPITAAGTGALSTFRKITPMICVNKVFCTSGASGQFVKRTKYLYSNPTFHSKGKGFVGFTNFETIDIGSKIGSELENELFTTQPIFRLKHSKSTKYNIGFVGGGQSTIAYSAVGNLISEASYTSVITNVNANSYLIQLTNSQNTDYLNSTRNSDDYVYNMSAHGNVQSVTSKAGWNLSAPIKTSITNNTYVFNNSVFKPLHQQVISTQAGEASYERNVDYAYDTPGHLISQTNDATTAGLSNSIVTTAYSQFNSFGDATKNTTSAPDITTRISEIQTDVTGRFVTKKINAIGDFSTYQYEPVFGNLVSAIDLTGLQTNYDYDGLGRLIKTTFANNAVSKTTYAWDDPANYPYDTNPIGAFSVLKEADAKPYVKSYYTGNGLELRAETVDFNGKTVISDNKYSGNSLSGTLDGYLIESTESHYPSQTKYLKTVYAYENTYFRQNGSTTYSVNGGSAINTGIFSLTNFNSLSTSSSYNSAFIEVINQNNQSVKKCYNSAGQQTLVVNGNNSQTQKATYTYLSHGQPKNITLTSPANPSQNIVHIFVYDGMAQKTAVIDPSAGTTSYTNNSIGELLQQTNPNGTYTYSYDILGRITTKTGSGLGATTYQYISSGAGKELIWKITGPSTTTEFQYDNFNRVKETKESINGSTKVFTSKSTYDNYGREIQHTFPSNVVVNYLYNSLSYLTAIKSNANQNIWTLSDMDALNRVREFNYGNGILNKFKYNQLHQLEEIEHGNLHKQLYTFDPLTGNMTQRNFKNLISNTNNYEIFGFDDNDRLGNSALWDPINNIASNINNCSFDVLGNLTHKDDAGDYHYTNNAKPFTLTQMTNVTNNISLNTLSIQHNDLDKVSQISEMGTNKQLNFTYGNDDERIKMGYSIGGTNQYTRYYGENYDRQENANGTYKEWTYIFAPSGLCMVVYNNNGASQNLYAMTDHLGSPVLLTSTTQSIVQEYSFDAWGRRRNVTDWSFNGVPTNYILIRGFTFHEHLDELAVINANARVYDPVLGRFIQPDNYIIAPDYLQNFNRYAYVYNNPLRYNDPTGNWAGWDDLAAILIGGGINVATHWGQINAGGTFHLDKFGEAFVVGAIAGEAALLTGGAALSITGFAGASVVGGAIAGFAGSAVSSPILGIGNSVFFGDSYSGKTFVRDVIIGTLSGAIVGGILGGYKHYKNPNYNMWTGKTTTPTQIGGHRVNIDKNGKTYKIDGNGKVTYPNNEYNINSGLALGYEDPSGTIRIYAENPNTGQIETMEINGHYNAQRGQHADFTAVNANPEEVMTFMGQGKSPSVSSDGKALYYYAKGGVKVSAYSGNNGPSISWSKNGSDFFKLRFK